MKEHRNKFYLSNFVFIVSLVILIINDHYLKEQFGNMLTGKLSDAAGIVILPLLLTFLFPFLRARSIWISAFLFAFWKSPFSQGFIDLYNQYSFIGIARVTDASDLLVLPLLLIPYLILRDVDRLDFIKIRRLHPAFILLPSIVALGATAAPPAYYYTRSDGNLRCYRCAFTVHADQAAVLSKLRVNGIVFDSTSNMEEFLEKMPAFKKEDFHSYRLNQLIIGDDTLRNIDFTMRTKRGRKTIIYFNGMDVEDDISTSKLYARVIKRYRTMLFNELRISISGE